MNSENVKNLILETGTTFGLSLLAILGSILAIMVGTLVFREGWRFLKDQSYSAGGYYFRKLPYAGYHRFRSKRWNMEHMA